MFLVRLACFGPLVDATSRLAQITKEVDVIFTPFSLRLVASHRSPHFVAMLEMPCQCFDMFSVNGHHCSSLSLESLHDVMLDSTFCSSMTLHLKDYNQIVFRFENPNRKLQFQHDLPFVPKQEVEIEEIDYGKFFSIDSEDLRRVIKELPLFEDDSVYVTATDLQVKFSIGSREIIFIIEDGQYKTVDFGREDEIRFRIVLNPMMIFLNLTYDAYRISFYKTKMNSYGVMTFPAFGELEAEYLFYFPQI